MDAALGALSIAEAERGGSDSESDGMDPLLGDEGGQVSGIADEFRL